MWVVKKNGGEVGDGAGESGNAAQGSSGQLANTEEIVVWKWERAQLNNVSEGCGGNNIPAWKHLISSSGPNLVVAASAADSLPESLLPC